MTGVETCALPIFFFFNDTATTEIYTLSLHDALPISTPRGAEVAKHDPNIDAFLIQDVDQVPNERLGE